MATQTYKTRTITGYISDLLEYPRWVFEREVDWDALVDDIFDHEKVICWW